MPAKLSLRVSGLVLALSALVLLAGCGGTTKTVYVSTPSASNAGSASAPTTGASTSTSASTPTSSASGEAPAPPTSTPSTTRTAPEPAFTEGKGTGNAGGEGLPAALVVLREHGYTTSDSADYHPNQTLQVLVGSRTGTHDGYQQQAFFFINGHYLGTDTKVPSAVVKVVDQSDTEVTLAYALYRPGDPLCCPGAGQAQVRFALNDGKLTPLGTIPPVTSSTAPSRH
jgi:LppP/LprE lipoprotein